MQIMFLNFYVYYLERYTHLSHCNVKLSPWGSKSDWLEMKALLAFTADELLHHTIT